MKITAYINVISAFIIIAVFVYASADDIFRLTIAHACSQPEPAKVRMRNVRFKPELSRSSNHN